MKTGKTVRRSVYLLVLCAALISIMLAGTAVCYAETPPEFLWEDVKVMSHCDAEVEGNTLVVTDTDFNEDVWDSKFLIDAGVDLEPGEPYTISFVLEGDEGVGEFFLCKGETMDIRYDETFTSEDGNRTIAFTPVADRVYIGMQVGNLGMDEYVTATVTNLCKLSESDDPALLRAENCILSIDDGAITATDNNDNNDVWNSKVLYDPGFELVIGKTYALNVDLRGDNGVGEFFLCRSQDLNDRYDTTFLNVPGSNSVVFKAESDKVYIGMQLGNAGNGNSVTARIGELRNYVPAAASRSQGSSGRSNVRYTFKNNVLTVTDVGDNNDVWNSQLVFDAGLKLVPGKQYMFQFSLSGDNGVGEFFLCKSKKIDDRYDATFTDAAGVRTVVFTAQGNKAYIGMQVGNVGYGKSVVLAIKEFKEYDAAAQKEPKIIIAQNCSYEVDSSDGQTVITAVDTNADKDVWTSKVLYFLGDLMEKGKFYAANFNLAGENGVGEFFFLKKDNMDDRYSFDDTPGDHQARFMAEDSKLYAGMQFGNIGVGNSVKLTIFDIFRIPGLLKSSENCEEAISLDAVTLTDTDDNPDVWNSKAVYDTGITLEPGQTYTATFTLSGANGVGEFFFLKSADINERYSFDNTSGEHTITFTADGTALYFGIQCGNIGNGNSVTVSNITITPNGPTVEGASAPEAALEDSGEEVGEETGLPEAVDDIVEAGEDEDEAEQEEEPAEVAETGDEAEEEEEPAEVAEAEEEEEPAEVVEAEEEEEPAEVVEAGDEAEEEPAEPVKIEDEPGQEEKPAEPAEKPAVTDPVGSAEAPSAESEGE